MERRESEGKTNYFADKTEMKGELRRMRRVSKRILSSVLTGAMLLSLISSSALAAEPITEPEESPQSNGMTYEDRDAIESIQATVVDSFYGYKVGSVEITYQPGTDLRDVENGTYTVWDRGFNNPEFGKLKITDTQVDDNVVTLIVDEGTDKVTDRTRETYGTLCTSSNWYIDNKGYVHYDGMEKDSIGKEILPNDINKGLQWRNLDLILTIDDQPVYDGIFSTDGVGNMLPDDMTVWEEPILPDGLDEVVLEMVDVGWEAEGYTQVNEQEGTEGRVPVQVIYPEGYDANRAEPYPTIVYQCGGGVCYWEDNGEYAANNLGCNVVYDVMMTEWHEQMPDAIVMSVNVHSTPIDNSATEIAGVLDYAIANWNVDKDRIIVVGNSQGTLISSDLIRQRPDLVAGFVECNGNLGAMGDATIIDGTLENSSLGSWTEEEVQAMIDNGVSVWMFNGETDGDNPAAQQDVIEIVKDLYREAGQTEEWIDEHVRASGLQSWKFKAWGETDHSVTKVVASCYLDAPYTDVWEGQADLSVGDNYTYSGQEESYEKYQYTLDYQYTVYPESVSEWAQLVIG